MSDDVMNDTQSLDAQWYLPNEKHARFSETVFEENGIPLLRVTLKEGRRITVFDIHPQAAREMGEMMVKWAEANGSDGES